jgi:HAMP domain-containing protein
MPTPRAGESQKDFVKRCIPVVLEDGTAKDQDQAVAVCHSMWRRREKSMDEETTTTAADATLVVEVKETEEKMYGELSEYDAGPISFSELKVEQAALEAAYEVNHMASEFPRMVRRIFNRVDVEDKDAALETLAKEFVTEARDAMEMELKQKPMKTVDGKKYSAGDFLVVEDAQKPTTWHLQVKRNDTPNRGLAGAAWAALFSPGGHRGNPYKGPGKSEAQRKLRALYKSQGWETPGTKESSGLFAQVVDALKGVIPQDEPPDSGLMIWKEADGTYRWLARYSNNFRDQDDPPEIIAEASHKRFVDLVDSKEVSPPDLWLWHVEDWKWGTANWVAYDDSGFALAGGTVTKGFEPLAEHLMALDPADMRVSHGMLKQSIVRDEDDPSVIVQHVTREISPLPAWAAANYMTGFILSKEASMAIPDEKRETLQQEWNLSPDLLSSVEAANAADKDTADETGTERKEKDDGTTEEAPPVEAETEAQPLSRDELGQVVTAIGQTLTAMNQQIAALAGEVKELKEAKAAEEEETLTDLFARAIGHEQARVDGRTKLARKGPKETPPDEGQPGVILTGNPLVDGMVNSLVTGDWTDGLIESQQGVEV